MNENIIKKTCKELGLTYKQLGELIGYNGDSLNTMANKSNDELSTPLKRAIELYLETLELKKQLQNTETLKNAIKTLLS
ncbi:transcriptional regulator [Campylobacter jejuni]|nr:transcriptional regulator [Campylobacter jejuni]EJD3103093.1 transcriptional regulator [Campylobacter jejuni]HDZ4960960.1 transcriptional regulator [Campylobacter jejuni]